MPGTELTFSQTIPAPGAQATAQVSGPSPFESMTPALAVVETLITSVVDALGEAGRRRFERFGEIAERWVRPWPDGADREGRKPPGR